MLSGHSAGGKLSSPRTSASQRRYVSTLSALGTSSGLSSLRLGTSGWPRITSGEQVERADGRKHETGGDYRAGHGVRVLPQRPGIQQHTPETREQDFAVRADRIAHGVLHPGIGGDDEVAGSPGAEENHQRRKPVAARPEPLFAE